MFLGWVGNFLMLAYLINYSLWKIKRYRILFYGIQGLLLGMLISFPLQGYGAFSIALSALHTFAWWLFTVWYFIDMKKDQSFHLKGWNVHNKRDAASIWFAKISLLLFAIASLGPFTLGVLAANGLGHSNKYYFALYYYLHFQYNGFFIFGILSLWFHVLEEKNLAFNIKQAKTSGRLLLLSLFPTYFLSIVWAKPGLAYNAMGFAGGLIQLLGFVYFLLLIREVQFTRATILWKISFYCFAFKIILQLLSAHPVIAQLALEVRPFVIAYLHLVVVGTVSFFLFAWCLEKRIIIIHSLLSVLCLLAGFAGSEVMILLSGVSFPVVSHLTASMLTFLFSIILLTGLGILMFRIGQEKCFVPVE
jgi:hypothetical protein